MEPWEIHPALVHFPIAFLLGAVVLDLLAWSRHSTSMSRTATQLFAVGVASGLIAMVAGALALYTVPAHTQEAHTMMTWHWILAVLSLGLFGSVAIARWRRQTSLPSNASRMVGMSAGGILLVVGFLGGQMVFRGGAGVQPSLLAESVKHEHDHGSDGHQGSATTRSEDASHSHSDEAAEKPNSGHAAHVTKRAPEQLPQVPRAEASAARVPAGYRVEIVLRDLNYPTSIEFDDQGTMYVAEAGYIYGDDIAKARLLRVRADGTTETAADSFAGPITDLLWHDKRLYISHRGKISVMEADGARDLATGLPSLGDHHNNQLAVGPDGMLYFGQGTATNSGVVGLDNFKMGWVAKYPEVSDIAAKDIRLSDQGFETPDILNLLADGAPTGAHQADGHETASDDPRKQKPADEPASTNHQEQSRKGEKSAHHHEDHGASPKPPALAERSQGGGHEGHDTKPATSDGRQNHETKGHEHIEKRAATGTVKTYAFQPFGKTPPDDGALRGVIKANGTILRMKSDGSNLEVYAWGLRNPFGLAWGTDGKLYASDNGYDERGSRPIAHAPDLLWEIKQDAWYGFPDYAGGVLVTDAKFRPENGPAPKLLMRDHPPVEQPVLTLAHHVGAAKLAVCRDDAFGPKGQLFLALSGDMNPITGAHNERSGFEVLRVDPGTARSESFFKAAADARGPQGLEYVVTSGPRRPVDVQFSPDGRSLYVVDVGAMAIVDTAVGPAPRPFPATGVVWRITRD